MEQFSFFRPHDIIHSSSFQCQKLHFNAPLPSERSYCFMSYRRAICSHHHPAFRFPTTGAGCAFSQWHGHDRTLRHKGHECLCGQAFHVWLFLTSRGCWSLLSSYSRKTKQHSLQMWRKVHFQCNSHVVHTELGSWERNKAVVLRDLTPIFKPILIQF